MKFNSQICTTRLQSKRLLALGLKKETADMHYCLCDDGDGSEYPILLPTPNARKKDIPAWSLHRLIEMYVERYLSCSVNLKNLTYEWIINEVEIHIKNGDFNKEYLV